MQAINLGLAGGGRLNLAGLCRTDGISRKTGRKWVQWFTSEG